MLEERADEAIRKSAAVATLGLPAPMPSRRDPAPDGARKVGSVQRAGAVLELFSVERPEWGLTEMAAVLGVAKSGLHALLRTLVEIGLLEQTPSCRYRLGWRSLSMAHDVIYSRAYRAAASEILRAMVNRLGATIHLAVLDRGHVVYLDKAWGAGATPIPTRVGMRLDGHGTAVGKVLLAHQPAALLEEVAGRDGLQRFTAATTTDLDDLSAELGEVREQGFAWDLEETIAGLHCVAAPVRGGDGEVVAAVSVAAARQRFEGTREFYRRAVQHAAHAVSDRLRSEAEGTPAGAGRGGRLSRTAL
jgi:DNA-binding IclR family transcriptional regulator